LAASSSAPATPKGTAAVGRAQQLDPQSAEARDALDKLRRGIALSVPERPPVPGAAEEQRNLAALAAFEAESPTPSPSSNGVDHHDNPLDDALELALGRLAELLFDEDAELAKPGSMGALTAAPASSAATAPAGPWPRGTWARPSPATAPASTLPL
jgi:hypothetical protein